MPRRDIGVGGDQHAAGEAGKDADHQQSHDDGIDSVQTGRLNIAAPVGTGFRRGVWRLLISPTLQTFVSL